MRRIRLRRLASLFPLLAVAAGCSSSPSAHTGSPTGEGNGVFESDSPTSNNGKGPNFGAGAPGGAVTAAPTADGGDEAARAIEEADIIKVEGQRLYALSQYGGLNVIDVSQRDHLKLLGRKKIQAVPFEMYVRDSIAFALYNGYGEYVHDAASDTWQWTSTSYAVALDTSDPANVKELGRFEVPGEISDSRIVGDVLYVVGFESGYCWHCDNGQRTTIVSLNVAKPAAISKIDQLSFSESTQNSYSWRRSISVTDKRMYVAGPEYGNDAPIGSTIQVVDISDPGGDLVPGTTIEAAGMISNRWQMDESDGVLRVVSQKASWRPELPPRIQTFRVTSSQQIEPLGAADMVVPGQEDLRSVRFDGPRAYAVTALQTDPLFTIDLSDPAAPRQVGALEIPGWVYFMEPRGDRVLGLGYDQNNPAGALAVSLFDVSNLAVPKLLDRVNFGGDWSWIGEDQDRVQKAFKVLDDAKLILMPFSGWSQLKSNNGCGGSYQTGVQLIDWQNDQLTLGGVAPAYGQARRGLLLDDRLLAVSDERVESFDITNRLAPQKTASLPLAHWVDRTVPAGEHVIRVAQNWWTQAIELDVTNLSSVASTDSLGKLEIPNLVTDSCNGGSWLRDVVASGDRAYVFYNIYDYTDSKSKTTTRVLTVDIADPAKPTIIGDAVLDFGGLDSGYQGIPGLYDPGTMLVASGSTVALLSGEYTYDAQGAYKGQNLSLRIMDMTNPAAPRVETHALPGVQNTTGLFVSGNRLVFGHSELSPTDPTRSRFYIDRYELSASGEVAALPSVNIPGSVVAYDASSERLFSADFTRVVRSDLNAQQCYESFAIASFEYQGGNYSATALGKCTAYLHKLRLVGIEGSAARLLGTVELDPKEAVSNVALGDDRLFVSLRSGYGYYGFIGGGPVGIGASDGIGVGLPGATNVEESTYPVLVASGIAGGDLAFGRASLAGGDYYSGASLAASGKRAVLSNGWRGKLSVLDATNVSAPTLVREESVAGYVQDLRTAGNVGIASLGQDGVQTISLDD
jgi:uncharacterized secreted protein with C-terminal beta-propeller domain